jgi:hypothetical protein
MRLNSLSITAATRTRSSGSGSRLWSAGAAVIRRMSAFGRSGLLSSSTHAPPDAAPQHALHLSVRIGIATGRLPYGCNLNNCAVKDRAKSESKCSASWLGCSLIIKHVQPFALSMPLVNDGRRHTSYC